MINWLTNHFGEEGEQIDDNDPTIQTVVRSQKELIEYYITNGNVDDKEAEKKTLSFQMNLFDSEGGMMRTPVLKKLAEPLIKFIQFKGYVP